PGDCGDLLMRCFHNAHGAVDAVERPAFRAPCYLQGDGTEGMGRRRTRRRPNNAGAAACLLVIPGREHLRANPNPALHAEAARGPQRASYAAAPVSASQISSTTASIRTASSPSPITRITGSVPEGRTSS